MTEQIFGLDFGTTKSLAAIVVGGEVQPLKDSSGRPHPSVVWHRGSEIIVGREARSHLENLEGGVEHGFVRSPKMALRREGPLHVGGRSREPVDVVAEVLRHLRTAALEDRRRPYDITQAVMTVPVDFAGPQRRALRDAARKAGIGVFQFVHEPVAALYAFLRSKPDFRRYITELENRVALVFDWGGGTLDLTLCRVLGGSLMQIASRGNSEIGGDRFDEKLRNHVRDKHSAKYHIEDLTMREQPGASAVLLTQCEMAKIELSVRDEHTLIVKDYLRENDNERHLAVDLFREDLEYLSKDLVSKGLAEIDRILEDSGLERHDVELCLATGGMVNMPAIRHGLVERFGARVPRLSNSDSIIAEGAAWIAHDRLRLKLAKPIELLVADGSGRGAYLQIVPSGLTLPVENQTIPVQNRRFFCIDPRDGSAVFEFVKPRRVGEVQPSDQREVLCVVNLAVDPAARPFLERLECHLQFDHDYVAHAVVRSKGTDAEARAELHQLDFALALPMRADPGGKKTERRTEIHEPIDGSRKESPVRNRRNLILPNLSLRSNVAEEERWTLVPGDLISIWRPYYLAATSRQPSIFQREEEMYYRPCKFCGRTSYEISRYGPTDRCWSTKCPEGTTRRE